MSDTVKRVTPNFIQDLAKNELNSEYKFFSPVNLNLPSMTKIELPELKWFNIDSEPLSTKVANTGQTVIVSGTWEKHRPKIAGGPLLTSYSFSQLHYHWGSDSFHGSEHSYNDKKAPLEMHAVFLKENCKKQEDALGEKDGAVVISYAYQLSDEPNPGIQLVCDELPYIPNPSQLIETEDPVKLTSFISPFKNDYFVYWGSVRTNACKHVLLWILCRQPFAVSEKQLEIFRSLFTSGHQPIMNNARNAHNEGYEVFHVNPSAYTEDVLYKKLENNRCKKVITLEKIKERKKRRLSSKYSVKSKRPSTVSLDVTGGTENNAEPVAEKEKLASSTSLNSNNSNECNKEVKININENLNVNETLKEPVGKRSENNNLKINNAPKRQSNYSKFFSARNNIEKTPNEKYVHRSGKGNITMNFISNKGESPFASRRREINAKQNITVRGNTQKNPIKRENGFFRQLKSQFTEAKTRLKNEVINNKKPQEEDVNTLKYINTRNMSNLETNEFHTSLPERKPNELDNIDEINRGQLLDVIRENSTENWEKFKKLKLNDSKEVTFNSNLNVNTSEVTSNILCYNVSEAKQQLKDKGDNEINSQINHATENELDNESYEDCCEEINELSNSNSTKSQSLDLNKSLKSVQEIGINTISLNELIFALSKESDYEKRIYNKLTEKVKESNLILSEDSNESENDINKALNDCNKKRKAKQKMQDGHKKDSQILKDFDSDESISNSQLSSQKLISSRTQLQTDGNLMKRKPSRTACMKNVSSKTSIISSNSNNSETSMNSKKSQTSVKSKKSKIALRGSSGDSSINIPNNSSNQKRITRNKSKKKSKSAVKETSPDNFLKKEEIKNDKTTKSSSKSYKKKKQQNRSNPSSLRSSISKTIPMTNYGLFWPCKTEPSKKLTTKDSKELNISSKSREKIIPSCDCLSKHSLHSQISIRSSERCASSYLQLKSDESPNHSCLIDTGTKQYTNRPSKPIPENGSTKTFSTVSSQNKRFFDNTIHKCTYSSTSEDEDEPPIQNSYSPTFFTMPHKCYGYNEKSTKETKEASKLLTCKDSLHMFEKSKETANRMKRIPMRKYPLSKRYDLNFSSILQRPQSVAAPRKNNTKSLSSVSKLRPKTSESYGIKEKPKLETKVKSQPSKERKSLNCMNASFENMNQIRPVSSRIPMRQSAAWRY